MSAGRAPVQDTLATRSPPASLAAQTAVGVIEPGLFVVGDAEQNRAVLR
jgi:hypothetical protein